jgi:glyoxylase-like metal-dependent hydrolase (beta-lactamase superfamily II)
MSRFINRSIIAFVAATCALAAPAVAQNAPATVERLYVIECGQGQVPDLSRWSPGVNVGKTSEYVSNCYLIKHAQGYLLWEMGVGDELFGRPEGRGAFTRWRLARTLASQLDEIGVKSSDIKFVAASHTHPDHVGNVELFPQAMLLMQKAEYEWPLANGQPRFKPTHPVTKLEGDFDVFRDGSATLLSTPGHTPGHQSILVRLARSGPILISGDAAHFRENWDFRRVPSFNVDVQQTLTSMDRIAAILAHTKAQLWIHHDKAQSDGQKKSPAYYD